MLFIVLKTDNKMDAFNANISDASQRDKDILLKHYILNITHVDTLDRTILRTLTEILSDEAWDEILNRRFPATWDELGDGEYDPREVLFQMLKVEDEDLDSIQDDVKTVDYTQHLPVNELKALSPEEFQAYLDTPKPIEIVPGQTAIEVVGSDKYAHYIAKVIRPNLIQLNPVDPKKPFIDTSTDAYKNVRGKWYRAKRNAKGNWVKFGPREKPRLYLTESNRGTSLDPGF